MVDFDYPLGVPKLRQYVEKIMKGVTGLTRPIPTILRNPLDRLIQKGERIHRKLQQVEKTLLLFKPYVYDYYQIFETQSFVSKEIEEKEFAFALQKMDWKKYWCEIHMPGLRKWCFPKIEGRAEEVFHPEFPVHLSSPSPSREKRETLERSQEVRP